MKKLIILVNCIALFAACNGNGDANKTTQPAGESQKPAETPAAVVQTGPEAFFKGSSDKLTLEVLASSDGTFPVTLKQADGMIYEGAMRKEGLMDGNKVNVQSGEMKFSGVLESAGAGTSSVLIIAVGDCKDSNGTTQSHSFKIEVGEKKFNGCGSYVE